MLPSLVCPEGGQRIGCQSRLHVNRRVSFQSVPCDLGKRPGRSRLSGVQDGAIDDRELLGLLGRGLRFGEFEEDAEHLGGDLVRDHYCVNRDFHSFSVLS